MAKVSACTKCTKLNGTPILRLRKQEPEKWGVQVDEAQQGDALGCDGDGRRQVAMYLRAEAGFARSMSRKGNCLDNACTTGLFGRMKNEFSRGRDWNDFVSFKADLESYIVHCSSTGPVPFELS